MGDSARRSRSPSGPPDALAMHSRPPVSSKKPPDHYFSDRSSKIDRPGGHHALRMPDNSINRESYDRDASPILLPNKKSPPVQPFRHVEPGTLDRERNAKQKRMADMLGDFVARNPDLSDHVDSGDVPAYLLAPPVDTLTVRSIDQKEKIREEEGAFMRHIQKSSGEVFLLDDDDLDKTSHFYRLVNYPLSDDEHEESEDVQSSIDTGPVFSPPRNSTISFSSEDSPRDHTDLSPWIEPERAPHHLDKLPGPVHPHLERHNPNAWPQVHVNLPFATWDPQAALPVTSAPSASKRASRPTVKSVQSADQIPKLISESTSSRRKKSPAKEAATTADQMSRAPSTATSRPKRTRPLPPTELSVSTSKRKASHTGIDEPQKRLRGADLPLYQPPTPIAAKKKNARKGVAQVAVASSGLFLPPSMRTPSPESKVEEWNFLAAPSQPEVSETARPRSSTSLKLKNPDAKKRHVGNARAERAVQAAVMPTPKTKDDSETIYDCACSYKDSDGHEAVQCDRCDSWQHAVCFYLEGADLQEVQHLCTTCKPRFVGDIASLDRKQEEVRGEPVVTVPVDTSRTRKDSATAGPPKRSAKGKEKEKAQAPGRNDTRRSREKVDYREKPGEAGE